MNKATVNIVRILGMLLLQIFIFNNVHLFGCMTPQVYLIALLLLPLEMPRSVQYLIAFCVGFTVDVFTLTYGIHASACLLMMFVRPYLVTVLNGRKTADGVDKPIPGVKDFKWIVIYTLLLALLHQTVVSMFETFSFYKFYRTFFIIIGNTLFTSILIICFEYIFISSHKKNR